MAAANLTCPNCQHQFESTAPPGQQVVCPGCRLFVLVPGTPPELPSWHVMRDGQRYGPYTLAQVQKMAGAGQVQPGDLVWKEGMPGWVEARTQTELFAGPKEEPELVHVQMVEPAPPEYRGGGAGMVFRPGGAGGSAFWLDLGVILLRAFSWNLGKVAVTDAEKEQLRARGVENETAQKYLAWRRSIFLVVGIATSIGALIHLITAVTQTYSLPIDLETTSVEIAISAFGVFTVVVLLLAQFALPAASLLAFVFWSRVRLTRRLILTGWAVSFLTPMVIALFPLTWFYTLPEIGSPKVRVALEAVFGIIGGLVYFLQLTPSVLALIPGALRACVRIKTLLPGSVIVGWFLMAGVPFYALLLLVTFISVNQLAGNALLILAILLFIGAPLAYVAGAGLFIRPLAEEKDIRKINYLQIIYSAVGWTAVLLFIIYLFTGKLFGLTIMGFGEGAMVSPFKLVQFFIDFAGRSLFTSTLVADWLMLMNSSVWFRLSEFAKTDASKQYDQVMGELGTALHRS
jgi:hypothetical protein